MAVQLIIDSASDLTLEEAKALGVKLIPIPINFGEQEYLSGVTITQEEFYNKLASCKELPTTSQPAPYEFEKAFQEVKDAGDEAVVLCISSALSGTYQSARAIAQDYPDCIWVVDTLSVTIGQRLLLDYALQLREKGYNAKRLAEEIEKLSNELSWFKRQMFGSKTEHYIPEDDTPSLFPEEESPEPSKEVQTATVSEHERKVRQPNALSEIPADLPREERVMVVDDPL